MSLRRHGLAWRWAAAAVCVAAAGCWGEGFRTAEVTGRVTVDGKPRGGLLVLFAPDDGEQTRLPPGYGYTNRDGQYRVFRPGSKTGAVVGKNNVRVLTMDGSEFVVRGRPVPNTAFARDIQPGPNTIDIDLTTE